MIITGQQKFDLHDVLNPVQIEITDDRILNKLERYKNAITSYLTLTSCSLHQKPMIQHKFLSTGRELNDGQIALINRKAYNIIGVINMDKISNWKFITGKSW